MIGLESKARFALFVVASGFAVSAVGCSAEDGAATEELASESVAQPIVGGQPASAYTEAALINMPSSICSGAIIAPRVVLTAGHCVGGSQFTVVAPYAGKSAKGTKAWTDYVPKPSYVNPNTNDVAVIVLDTPITLAWYPPLANVAVAAGTKAVNVGRIQNGQASYSGLFYGKDVTLKSGPAYGFPFSYVSEEIIQSGDSGGPVYVGSGASRKIVAVNSGAGGGTQVLARVDLAYAKIQQLIADNGGGGGSATSSSGGGASSGGASSGGASSGSSGAACASTESEPNDDSNAANPLGAKTCGALSTGADVDWFTWDVAGAGVAYDVSLTATGDADVLMWKFADGAWHRITNTTATQVAATSNGPGAYVVAVRSPGGAPQSYTLSLTK
ncbi:MAG: trypsin-like serine protease [Labilithrix sp.]|nr:trypsin-like serine protease [Labilithrix sp.]